MIVKRRALRPLISSLMTLAPSSPTDFFFAPKNIRSHKPGCIRKQRIGHGSIENGKLENVPGARQPQPPFPSGNHAGAAKTKNPRRLLLVQATGFSVSSQKIRYSLYGLFPHRVRASDSTISTNMSLIIVLRDNKAGELTEFG